MTYGPGRALPAEQVRVEGTRLRPAFAEWSRLDKRSRLQLVERALEPANDLIDAYPIAL